MSLRLIARYGLSLAACAAIAIAASSAAASSSRSSNGSNIQLPPDVATSHTIHASVFLNYPPYEYLKSGHVIGLDVSLVDAIAKVLGVKVSLQQTSFEAEIPGVQTGRYDMTLGDFEDTAARRKLIGFVDILKSRRYLLVQKGNPNHISTKNLCGVTMAAVDASYEATMDTELKAFCARAHKTAPTLESYADTSGMFEALSTGRAQAAFYDPAAAQYIAAHSSAMSVIASQNTQVPVVGSLGWPMPKNAILGKAFVAAIKILMKEGKWQKIFASYGVAGVEVDPPTFDTRPVS